VYRGQRLRITLRQLDEIQDWLKALNDDVHDMDSR
jgi:hypothetical protein